MQNRKLFFSDIIESKLFNYFIFFVVILNAIVIGLEVSSSNNALNQLQIIFIIIFCIELIIRYLAISSFREFISNKWIIFDITILSISVLSEFFHAEHDLISSFRVLRIILILRLFKTFPNFNKMVRVLVQSIFSIFPTILFFFVFLYLYSLVGVALFKDVTAVTNNQGIAVDPFGSISEAFFSLFRVTTGEDWTDLRYDLMAKHPIFVNIYFISWFILSAFLLLNIITGSIISNYSREFESPVDCEQNKKLDDIAEKLERLERKVNHFDNQKN